MLKETETNRKINFFGNYSNSRTHFEQPFELSECSDYGRHLKTTRSYGKFIVIKNSIKKHFGMDYFSDDNEYWYFKR